MQKKKKNNNNSGLINFEVKTSSSKIFWNMNSELYVQILFIYFILLKKYWTYDHEFI